MATTRARTVSSSKRSQTKTSTRLPAFLKRAGFVAAIHPAVQPLLVTAIDLPTFLAKAGSLTLADRQRIVEQALILIEQNYVHLPLKKAMHAVDPVQKLKLLQFRLAQTTQAQLPPETLFHEEMTTIFDSVHDLHTNYLLPAPYNQHTAILPFQIEEYFVDKTRKYLVSKLVQGFRHPTFVVGVEVTHWNGIPLDRAVERIGEQSGGSNLEAQHARGLDALTVRPLFIMPPPDEEWVVVSYRTEDGKSLELKQPWLITQAPNGASGGSVVRASRAGGQGIDLRTHAIQQVKKALFAPESLVAEQQAARTATPQSAVDHDLPTSLPDILRAKPVQTSHGTFGYIRIFNFEVNNIDAFVQEFARLAAALPSDGLIVDVRDNGGGMINAGERILQILTPRWIEPERFEFINTSLNLAICLQNAPSPIETDLDLSAWIPSMQQAVETAATFSLGFPLTSPEACNDLGQKYYGPVVLIIDARCYSTTDMFIAGFRDHEIGQILGTDGNSGAGGANVWEHSLLSELMSDPKSPNTPLPDSPYRPLPNGANMRVAMRRSLRVGEHAGTPVEDLGVVLDQRHYMTRRDVLQTNEDLIDQAAAMLSAMLVRQLDCSLQSCADGVHTVTAATRHIARLDIYLDGRPQQSLDVLGATTQFHLAATGSGSHLLQVEGWDEGHLVAVRRIPI